MRLKTKKIIGFWLVLVLVAITSGAVAGDAILHPGYIEGTITVTGEEVTGGTVDAYSLTGNYDGHDYDALDGNYFVTVEGGYDYKVFSEAHITADYALYRYQSTVSIGRKDTYVEVGQTIENFNFVLDPGRIAPNVTVTGGEIQRMAFYVRTDFELPELETLAATHYVYGKNVLDPDLNQWVFQYLDGDESSFPMRPWVSTDANGDGDYSDPGDTYVMVNGWVWINDIQFNLPSQYIDVIEGMTTNVEWSLDASSTRIEGSVVVQGKDILSYYYLNGDAYIEGTPVKFLRSFPGDEGYYVNVPPATWDVTPNAWFTNYPSGGSNVLVLPTQSVTVHQDEYAILDWDIVAGYVTGSIDLYGAYGNLYNAHVYAGGAGHARTTNMTSDYRLILYEGQWAIGYPYTYLFFSYDNPDVTSNLLVTDYGIFWSDPPTSVTPGDTVSGVDLSYGTATITVNYWVDLPAGPGELRSPVLIAKATEGTGPDRIVISARGQGSNELTTLGECTITVLAGTYTIEAYATVEGSYTKFGEFTVSVEPGDVIKQDIEAPTVDIAQPGGSEHICGSSVDVVGTTTDDSGVSTITVNDEIVEFFPTNNPDDENEVSFSTTVEGLVVNEWNIITIVITDTLGNSITVERQVFRDPCNLPPEIILISGPLDPVALGAYYEMTGIFTDPDDGDTHTATWDWGDGTTSGGTVDQANDIVTGFHEYAIPGVYTVTLTVVDSFEESDTATWSQFIVIYDPSGGFVTGGGWINSPEGAYFADPDLNGKANFGFVAKYKKGSDVPIGNTEFQFQLADLNFHSDTYQWLVIAGARAKFKGSGTINGEGSYKFMLTAVDGELVNNGGVDKFRLKIWVEDEATGEEIIIYDNMLGAEDDAELDANTEIGGGSIMIHDKPK